MSEKSLVSYTLLHLSFRLKVPPHVLLAEAREAARVIASTEGLIWKIWLSQGEEFEMGGVYLFATREAAEAYLEHPVVKAVGNNPAVLSTHSQLWEVNSSLSALTRAPLPNHWGQSSVLQTLIAGGLQ